MASLIYCECGAEIDTKQFMFSYRIDAHSWQFNYLQGALFVANKRTVVSCLEHLSEEMALRYYIDQQGRAIKNSLGRKPAFHKNKGKYVESGIDVVVRV